MGNAIVRLGAVAVSLAVLGACAAQVEPEDRSDAPGESEAALGATTNWTTGIEEPPKPSNTCRATGGTCDADFLGSANKEARLSGCGASYQYFYHAPGTHNDFDGGIVALCPDTPRLRARYGAPIDCRDCLPAGPRGTVYFYTLKYQAGPGCSHGCGYGVRAGNDTPDTAN
jgi:hypothetical protein